MNKTGDTTFNGTVQFTKKFKRSIATVSNGTASSNNNFFRVTVSGNVALYDGVSTDNITIKNDSGGAITIIPTSDTIDGNTSITLNNKEAVNLISTGTDWLIH
jgi:1-deoxy-D-xylulose 5-phosphate reductoisomerase